MQHTHTHKHKHTHTHTIHEMRTGTFSDENFRVNATLPQVKMIEIKLSQGAKPAHGGVLPKEKINKVSIDNEWSRRIQIHVGAHV